MHEALTRQGGTSGSMSSRGSGEKKLELDRRRIEHRLTELKKELEEVTVERRVQRRRRQAGKIPLVALVGYTNAGKSTIMNAMVDAYVQDEEKRVLEEDMLFATLDTSVRRINTGNNQDFLLSDTVGFIHKLPHDLVKAFRSTLEEVQNADLLLHVADCSDPFYQEQMKTTLDTLGELGAGDIPMLTIYNKADLSESFKDYPQRKGDKLYLCAREEESLRLLTEAILEKVYADWVEYRFLIPFEKGNVATYLMENAQVISRRYTQEGTELAVKCHKMDKNKFAEYTLLAEPDGQACRAQGMNVEKERLNKYLASCGVCSRREADRLIEEGRVTVNGATALPGMRVESKDRIAVNGRLLHGRDEKVVFAYNKPSGVTCTERDKYADKKISDVVKFPVRVTYAGRLDKDSQGLLLLTNDGVLIEAMMRGKRRP